MATRLCDGQIVDSRALGFMVYADADSANTRDGAVVNRYVVAGDLHAVANSGAATGGDRQTGARDRSPNRESVEIEVDVITWNPDRRCMLVDFQVRGQAIATGLSDLNHAARVIAGEAT